MPVADSDVSEILMDDTDDSPRLSDEGTIGGAFVTPKPRAARGTRKARTAPVRSPRASSGPSGAKELANGLATLLGGFSLLLGLAVFGPSDYELAAMTRDEATGLAKLPARLLARSRIAAQVANAVPLFGDVVEFLFAGLSWWMRVYPLIVLRQAQNAAAQRAQKGQSNYVNPSGAQAVQPSSATKPASNGASSPPTSLANIAGAGYADPDQLAAWNHTNVSADYRSVTQ